jgi:hypothetical protein
MSIQAYGTAKLAANTKPRFLGQSLQPSDKSCRPLQVMSGLVAYYFLISQKRIGFPAI